MEMLRDGVCIVLCVVNSLGWLWVGPVVEVILDVDEILLGS